MSIHTENREIAFVIEALTVGGAEQMLVAMANRFAARNWRVHMICLTAAGELAARLDPAVEVTVLDKKPGFDWRIAGKLRRTIARMNPVAINSHLWTANLWSRVAFPFSNKRLVATEHSRDTWKPTYYRVIDRILALWTHKVVAVSRDTHDFYAFDVGINPKRIRVINNGIETSRFAAGNGRDLRAQWASNDECLIGTVGRLVPAKNHTRLIEAVKLLEGHNTPFKVVIVGDGELQARISAEVDNQGLSHRIIMAGARSDIPDVLDAFDIFVLSSDREGHPLTALEAQAAGTPVVLTDAGGSRDAIATDGSAAGGIIVDKSAAALADAIRKLIEDPSHRHSMAASAKRIALEQFDLETMVDHYEQVFVD